MNFLDRPTTLKGRAESSPFLRLMPFSHVKQVQKQPIHVNSFSARRQGVSAWWTNLLRCDRNGVFSGHAAPARFIPVGNLAFVGDLAQAEKQRAKPKNLKAASLSKDGKEDADRIDPNVTAANLRIGVGDPCEKLVRKVGIGPLANPPEAGAVKDQAMR